MDNLLRYTTVEDEGSLHMEPDPWETDVPYDEPTLLTAFFAAPREEMTTVDVYLYGNQPIMDVPVESE